MAFSKLLRRYGRLDHRPCLTPRPPLLAAKSKGAGQARGSPSSERAGNEQQSWTLRNLVIQKPPHERCAGYALQKKCITLLGPSVLCSVLGLCGSTCADYTGILTGL
jgi:hypothetical protein